MITWHEKGPYSFYASIQGMTIDLEAYGRKWHVSIGNSTVFTLPTSITADEAKAAAEKELIEILEDAIKDLVGPGKQAVFNYVTPSAHTEPHSSPS